MMRRREGTINSPLQDTHAHSSYISRDVRGVVYVALHSYVQSRHISEDAGGIQMKVVHKGSIYHMLPHLTLPENGRAQCGLARAWQVRGLT